MSADTPRDAEAVRAEYLDACRRAFDLDAWLEARAIRERWEEAAWPQRKK